jgi:hypothetical protein
MVHYVRRRRQRRTAASLTQSPGWRFHAPASESSLGRHDYPEMAIAETHESACDEDAPSAAIAARIWAFWAQKHMLPTPQGGRP